LDQFNKGLQDSLLVRIILFRLCPKPIPRSLFGKLFAPISSRGTSISNLDTSLSGICTKLAHVCTPKNGSTAKPLARVLSQNPSLLGSCACLTAGFIERDSAPTKAFALR
jgi:hypothetical protein